MLKLAKWYRQNISPQSVSDKIKTPVTQNLMVTQVIATYALRCVSADLPNIITAVNSIRDTTVSFEVAVNRNW